MAFPHRAEAHDEPSLTRAQPGLIRRCDDGWIPQRCGLDGVLVCEVKANELFALSRNFVWQIDAVRDQSEVVLDDRLEVWMTTLEVRDRLFECGGDVVFGHGHDAIHDDLYPRPPVGKNLLAGQERFGYDPTRVGHQPEVRTGDWNRGHRNQLIVGTGPSVVRRRFQPYAPKVGADGIAAKPALP